MNLQSKYPYCTSKVFEKECSCGDKLNYKVINVMLLTESELVACVECHTLFQQAQLAPCLTLLLYEFVRED